MMLGFVTWKHAKSGRESKLERMRAAEKRAREFKTPEEQARVYIARIIERKNKARRLFGGSRNSQLRHPSSENKWRAQAARNAALKADRDCFRVEQLFPHDHFLVERAQKHRESAWLWASKLFPAADEAHRDSEPIADEILETFETLEN